MFVVNYLVGGGMGNGNGVDDGLKLKLRLLHVSSVGWKSVNGGCVGPADNPRREKRKREKTSTSRQWGVVKDS